MRLFARDIKGNIKEWNIALIENSNSAIVRTGRLNGNLIETIIEHNNIQNEIASRIAKKRKEGYVSLKDIGYTPYINTTISTFLESNLPMFNTDANNNLKPMKCQKFKERVIKYPAYAQPKLNGLRAVLRWEEWTEGEGLFSTKKEGAKIRTKIGQEYVMPHITKDLTKMWFETKNNGDIAYDGELYIHGKSLSYIKASCPMTNDRGTISRSTNDPMTVSFHCFDVAMPDLLQPDRLTVTLLLNSLNHPYIKRVDEIIVNSDDEVLAFRDKCISEGYEGCVVREMNTEYAFGFRPKFIRKCKTYIDSEFLIVGVTRKPSDETLPMLILKNDINDATFESVLMGDYKYQREILENIDNYIGKYATVRYRERTGTVDKLPFHTNVLEKPFVSDIRNTKDDDYS